MRKSKNIEPHLVPRLGPRVEAEAGVERFEFHEIMQGFKFSGKNIRETTKNSQKINETRSQKKRAVSL